MNAVDSSVVIAGFSSWHVHHEPAREALRAKPHLPAHAAVEAYSVLTRLPHPFRSSPSLVHSFLVGAFGDRTLWITTSIVDVIDELAALDIGGGAAYDALIGMAARQHEATLLTLDRRARETYDRLGVDVRVLS